MRSIHLQTDLRRTLDMVVEQRPQRPHWQELSLVLPHQAHHQAITGTHTSEQNISNSENKLTGKKLHKMEPSIKMRKKMERI